MRVPSRVRDQRGAVTAETVMVLPVLVVTSLALIWLLALASVQLRLVDAAREVARAVARDEAQGDALDLGRRVAPDGARFRIVDRGGLVVVTAETEVDGVGPFAAVVPRLQLEAEAVAGAER